VSITKIIAILFSQLVTDILISKGDFIYFDWGDESQVSIIVKYGIANAQTFVKNVSKLALDTDGASLMLEAAPNFYITGSINKYVKRATFCALSFRLGGIHTQRAGQAK